jgi:hypothetical protein
MHTTLAAPALTAADRSAFFEGLEAAQRTPRERVAAGESPFLVYRDHILQYHSTALRLQAVVLNLYNDGDWAKKAPVYLATLIANADELHFEILISLLRAYAKRGENDREFLALGRQLAETRLRKGRRS